MRPADGGCYENISSDGVQIELRLAGAEAVGFTRKENDLAKAVPSWENPGLAEEEGFEPPVSLRPRLISSQVP